MSARREWDRCTAPAQRQSASAGRRARDSLRRRTSPIAARAGGTQVAGEERAWESQGEHGVAGERSEHVRWSLPHYRETMQPLSDAPTCHLFGAVGTSGDPSEDLFPRGPLGKKSSDGSLKVPLVRCSPYAAGASTRGCRRLPSPCPAPGGGYVERAEAKRRLSSRAAGRRAGRRDDQTGDRTGGSRRTRKRASRRASRRATKGASRRSGS